MIGPFTKPPSYRELQIQLMAAFGLEVSPLLAFKRDEQWIALEGDAELIRAFDMTHAAWHRAKAQVVQEAQRSQNTLAEEADVVNKDAVSQAEQQLQRPELVLLLTSYDAVDGRRAARSFANLLENAGSDPDTVLSIPLHCRDCKQLQHWTLKLSRKLCGEAEGARKRRRKDQTRNSEIETDATCRPLDPDREDPNQKHNESCRVTVSKHAKGKCGKAAGCSDRAQGPLDRFVVRESASTPKVTVVSFAKDVYNWVDEEMLQHKPTSDHSAASANSQDESEEVVIPSPEECTCALPYGAHVSKIDTVMLPYEDVHAVKSFPSRGRKFTHVPTPGAASGTHRGRKVINENQICPTTIVARNPSSGDYWRQLSSTMKLPIELSHEQEVIVQQHLRQCDERDLRTRQSSNRMLVKKAAALRAGLKRSRDHTELDFDDSSDDGDAYEEELRDGMRPWLLPRVIQLNVPADANLGTRSLVVTAVLMYLDSPNDCANGLNRCNYHGPVRACEFHRIASVVPDDGRFTQYIGHMFSSLDVSFRLFACKKDSFKASGWSSWSDVLTQTTVMDLAQWGAFTNPPHMDGKPLCRDYCASLCIWECHDECAANISAVQTQLDQEAPNEVKYRYDNQLDCTHDLTRVSTSMRGPLNVHHGRSMPIWEQSTRSQRAQCPVKFWNPRASSHFLCTIGSNPHFEEPKPVMVLGRDAWRLREEIYVLDFIYGTQPNDDTEFDTEEALHIGPDTMLVTQWVNRRDSTDHRRFNVKVSDFPQKGAARDMLKDFIAKMAAAQS